MLQEKVSWLDFKYHWYVESWASFIFCNGVAESHSGQEQSWETKLHDLESSSVSTHLIDFDQTEWLKFPY